MSSQTQKLLNSINSIEAYMRNRCLLFGGYLTPELCLLYNRSTRCECVCTAACISFKFS